MKDRHGNDVKPGDRVRLCGERLSRFETGYVRRHSDRITPKARITPTLKGVPAWMVWATSAEIELEEKPTETRDEKAELHPIARRGSKEWEENLNRLAEKIRRE